MLDGFLLTPISALFFSVISALVITYSSFHKSLLNGIGQTLEKTISAEALA